MELRKLNRFSIISLLIFFFFLNGICLASPSSIRSFVNEQFSFCPFHDSMDLVEESFLHISSSQNTENNLSRRTQAPGRFLKKDENTADSNYFVVQEKIPLVFYNPLLRPAYYSLLFRYTLF